MTSTTAYLFKNDFYFDEVHTTTLANVKIDDQQSIIQNCDVSFLSQLKYG